MENCCLPGFASFGNPVEWALHHVPSTLVSSLKQILEKIARHGLPDTFENIALLPCEKGFFHAMDCLCQELRVHEIRKVFVE